MAAERCTCEGIKVAETKYLKVWDIEWKPRKVLLSNAAASRSRFKLFLRNRPGLTRQAIVNVYPTSRLLVS